MTGSTLAEMTGIHMASVEIGQHDGVDFGMTSCPRGAQPKGQFNLLELNLRDRSIDLSSTQGVKQLTWKMIRWGHFIHVPRRWANMYGHKQMCEDLIRVQLVRGSLLRIFEDSTHPHFSDRLNDHKKYTLIYLE